MISRKTQEEVSANSRTTNASISAKSSLLKTAYKKIKFDDKVLKYYKATQLSRDHVPTCPDEKLRIQNTDVGTVSRLTDRNGNPAGPYRVFDKKMNEGGLAMSRSIGDTNLEK